MNIKRWLGKNAKLIYKEVSNMEAVLELRTTTKISPIGESIKSIQKIANKYMKTIEDERKAEERLRQELRKQGYTRF